MSLDKRLRELYDMPENEALKKKIKQSMTEATPKKTMNLSSWKEVIVSCAVIAITLFLLFTPTLQKNQATSDDIQHIYTFFSAKEGEFRARASLQYVGMQDLKNDVTVQLFNQVEQMEVVENGSLGPYFVDVIVVRNHEKQQRYQLSDTTLYDVDNNIYYTSDDPLYSETFDVLFNGKHSRLTMLLPIAVIFLNIVSSYLYKRKGIKLPETNKNAMKYSLLFLLLLAGIFMYAIFIGPLYKPVLYLFAFIYGYLLWRVLKLNAQHLYVYKVERAKAAILVLVILAFVYNL